MKTLYYVFINFGKVRFLFTKYTEDKLCIKLVFLNEYIEMHGQQNIKQKCMLFIMGKGVGLLGWE
jgi:hypothetical protein